MTNPEEFLTQCDACGELKYGCVDLIAYGLDTHACPKCRNEAEDDDPGADYADWRYHQDHDS
jgi:hypothetical protein